MYLYSLSEFRRAVLIEIDTAKTFDMTQSIPFYGLLSNFQIMWIGSS